MMAFLLLDGPQTFESRIRIVNISSAPNPEQIPFSSDPANIQWSKDVKAETKAKRRPAPTLSAVNSGFEAMSSKLDSGFSQVVQAIKSQSPSQPAAQPSILSGVNWTPIIQSLVSGIGTALGAQVSFSQPTGQLSSPLEKSLPLTPSSQTSINLTSIETRIDKLESGLNSMQASLHSVSQSLSTQIENLVKSQTQTNNQME